ncbi:MAG: hypothetical protein Q8L77_17150 [Nitrospirota bacterium]|nr:hypothetical protein [Nitrospirota bacterium]
MRILVGAISLMLCLGLSSLALSQMPLSGQNQAGILKLLGELPPDTMKKVEALGKILQQDVKEGKLTDAQMHEELLSGNLDQKIRGLNPEAGPLLDDIGQAMKNHPNAENLPNLLNGMTGGTGR